MNTDGLISFGQPITQFPLGNVTGLQLIAPFLGDADTMGTGEIWYRETRNSTVLNRAREEILEAFTNYLSFQPEFAIITTWDKVGYFDSQTDLVSCDQFKLVKTFGIKCEHYICGRLE